MVRVLILLLNTGASLPQAGASNSSPLMADDREVPRTGDPAAVVVIVAADSPVHTLSREQVESIFLGRDMLLPDGSRARPVSQPRGSEARVHFLSRILERSESQYRSQWARLVFTGRGRAPAELADSRAVVEHVAQNAGAIGYVQRRALDDSVRVVYE